MFSSIHLHAADGELKNTFCILPYQTSDIRDNSYLLYRNNDIMQLYRKNNVQQRHCIVSAIHQLCNTL